MITVCDFMELCFAVDDQKFALYDMTKDVVVWSGVRDDLPEEYEGLDVWSYDGIMPNSDVITLNIEVV